MSLSKYLERRPSESSFLFSKGGWQLVSEVLSQVDSFRCKYGVMPGDSVLLVATSDHFVVHGILSLDSYVKRVVIVKTDSDTEYLKSLKKTAQIDLVISEENLELSEKIAKSNTRNCEKEVNTEWIIPTSGTTGEPKLVKHSIGSLSSAIKKNESFGSTLTWGMIYDVTRFAGLQVLLQALMGGSKLAMFTDTSDLVKMASELDAAGVNALSATPTMWKKLLMSGSLDSLDLKLITLGGEISDQMILDNLQKKFPAAKITSVYASTEAGVAFSVTDGKAGFPVSYTEGALANGAELKVKAGMLYIKKQSENASYIQEAIALIDEDGWVETGDLVELRSERYHFLGRKNGTINVGGQKVQPSEVEAIISAIDGVAMVAVRGRSNPFTGSIVEALIVKDDSVEFKALKKNIIKECRGALDSYKVPGIIKQVEEIEVTAAGKIKRS